MKLCPQCEFIYENEQSVCDMDGNELVYDPAPLPFQENAASPTQALHELPANPVRLTVDFPASQPSRWQSKGSAVVALAAIIFAALLFAVYYAGTHQPRSVNANQASSQTAIQSSTQATELANAAAESKPDFDSATPEPLTPSAELPLASTTPLPVSISPEASYGRERMLSNPVSAGASGAEKAAPVVIRLTNGSSIKADEAWEKREGVWYRQGGVVTFLRRRQVRSIQRLDAAGVHAKTTSINPKTETAIAQNQPRIYKSDVGTTKKNSKVGSLLKKTGRILKKPFKF